MNNRIKNWLLERDDDGFKTIIIKVETPPLISNRCIVSTLYQYMREDGSFCAIQSARGNEKLEEKYKDQIGSDEIARQNVCMTKLIPFDGGCELHQVLDVDPKGLIPGFIKSAISKRSSMNAMYLVDFMMNGTLPPQM